MVQYLPILAMVVLVALFVALSFVASTLLAPRSPNPAKTAPYESGIVPEVAPAERFPVKFYLVALTFIVLDVEIIFLYPFTTVYRAIGVYGLVAMGVFLIVLLVPFAYLLSTGALDWGPIRRVVERSDGGVLRASGMPGRDGMALEPASGEPTSTEPGAAA